MALPTGLLPVLAFVLTVGVAVPVTGVTHLLHRRGPGPFSEALRDALASAGLVYLLGVLGVWAWAGFGSLWGVPVALVASGLGAAVFLVAVPLAVGRWLLERVRGVDPERALRFATDGWALAMLVIFGVFVAPGGLVGGTLFDLEGPRTCLVGFCGVSRRLLAAGVLELVVAWFGPGLIGLALHGIDRGSAGRGAEP